MPDWLSALIISVIEGPHAAREAGPMPRGMGLVTIPWLRTVDTNVMTVKNADRYILDH